MEEWHAGARVAPGQDAPSGQEAPPVLIAHGSEDVVIPAANAETLRGRWPGARVELFDGGGHAFMAQEPDRLAACLCDFLA